MVFSSLREPYAKVEFLIKATMVAADILKIPFDFMYFSFCSPFRFAIHQKSTDSSEKNKNVTTTHFMPQKVVCAILTILDLFCMFYMIRVQLPLQQTKNAQLYIGLFGSAVSHLAKCVFFGKLWGDESKFLKIANFVGPSETVGDNKKSLSSCSIKNCGTKYRTAYLVTLTCLVYLSLGIVNFTRLDGVEHSKRPLFSREWFADMITIGKKFFFVANGHQGNFSTGKVFSCIDVLFGVSACLGLLHRFA